MKITINKKGILPCYLPYMRDYETRVNAFYGGAGSGKSYFVMQKIVLKALDSQRKVLIVRKVGATLKESVWSLTLELIHTGGLAPTVKQINKSDLTIEFLNGSVLLFKGLDDSEKIKSINGITDIVIEEATEITLDDFTQLNLRLRSKKPNNQIHLMFNPVSKANWVYKYFFETKADNCVIVQTTYRDNPHLPKEYVNSLHALENKNPAYYKIYVRGEFATLDKLVFPVIHKRIISEDELTDAWFWVGMDFGYTNDPTAITWGYYNPVQNDLYITGEYDKIGMTNDVIAETLVSLGLGKEKIVADSAEPKSITELRNLGIKRIIASVKGADSVKNGIDRMQRCNIIIDERCTKTIEEFENYTWQKDKKTGEYINQPVDSYNHHIDSIRYGIQTVINKKRGKTAEYQSIL
jgi:phage terminase large subunit